jgi:hypothetical protein
LSQLSTFFGGLWYVAAMRFACGANKLCRGQVQSFWDDHLAGFFNSVRDAISSLWTSINFPGPKSFS